jgi:SPP1 gp7 family putative phage head morphogenesis protein
LAKVYKFFRLSPLRSNERAHPRIMQQLTACYSSTCTTCGGITTPANLADIGNGFDSILSDIATQLYTAKANTGTIHPELYSRTADTLIQAVFSGMGGKEFGYDDPSNNLLIHLRHNVYAFSAAKSLTQMQAFNDLLTDKDGNLRTQAQFTAAVAATGAVFNKTHLTTEAESAVGKAQTAQDWNQYGDDDYLQVSTAGDKNVRPEHARMDGFTEKKSAKIWLKLIPPFAWKCRCRVIPGIASRASKDYSVDNLVKEVGVTPYFQSNPGITRTVFDKSHPHFTNLKDGIKTISKLEWDTNYDMKTIGRIYTDVQPAPLTPLADAEAADRWFVEKQKDGKIEIKDIKGNTIALSKRTFNAAKDDAYAYIHNAPSVLTSSDEVWSTPVKSAIQHTYIKYYEGAIQIIQAVDGNITSIQRIPYSSTAASKVNAYRMGTLQYRNYP